MSCCQKPVTIEMADEPPATAVPVEAPPEPSQAPPPSPVEAPQEPKKRGRPPGAKDKVQRTRRKVTVTTEFLEQPKIESGASAAEPLPVPSQGSRAAEAHVKIETQPSEAKAPGKASMNTYPEIERPASAETPSPPASPRTIMRDSARHVLRLSRLTADARKAHLREAYVRGLATL